MTPLFLRLLAREWRAGEIRVLLLAVALLLCGGGRWSNARAEPAALYDLSWWTVGGGGASTTGGPYTLGGTIGQADAAQWAEWGFDYVKYDWHNTDMELTGRLSRELRKSSRDMIFSIGTSSDSSHRLPRTVSFSEACRS